MAGKREARIRKSLAAFLLPAAVLAASCFPARPVVSPPPADIETIEGFASLRLTREAGTAKSKFSFLLRPPNLGRVEVYDPLRRTVLVLLFTETEAFFILPGKRAYWRATREEVLDRLLGFDIEPRELAGMLTGRWDGLSSWSLERDSRGRVARGRRAEVGFEVREFFERGNLPEVLVFSSGGDRGSLKILRLSFNQPIRNEVLRPSFLEDPGFREASWEEMEKWLREMARR
jgi:outer membrane biogenesis lipoprotein LolB